MTPDLVSESDIDAFQQQGAVVLRGVFNEWVEPLRDGIEKNIQ